MPTKILSNEFRLLVAASWTPPEPLRAAQGEQVRALSGKVSDWDHFLALTLRHQIPALACLALERWGGDAVPGTVLAELRRLAASTRTRSLLTAAEGARIARALAAQHIPVLPLKGAPLSLELYGDPAARHSTDVDILIRGADLDRTESALTALGYQPEIPRDRWTPRLRRLLRACSNAATYRHPRLKLAVDLHWHQELWTPAQVDALWRQSHDANRLGAPMRLLDGDPLLLYLCDHGTKHDWSRLKWLSDIAVLLARPRHQPWEELFVLARELDAAVALAVAALLVQWLYGLDLPPELTAFAQRAPHAAELARESIAALGRTHDELAAAARRQWIGRKLHHQILRKPALPLSQHLRARLLHADDLARFAVPDSLLWLHYPLRPLFWLWRQCRPAPLPAPPTARRTVG